jgi:hypothetical protein
MEKSAMYRDATLLLHIYQTKSTGFGHFYQYLRHFLDTRFLVETGYLGRSKQLKIKNHKLKILFMPLMRCQALRAGQLADQLLRMVNEHREMLRADPILGIAIGNGQQRDFVAGLGANQALGF